MAIEKIKKVEVETSKGKRYLYFRYLDLDPDSKISCETVCKYGNKLCTKIKDPRNPDDKYSRFVDFCAAADDILNKEAEEKGLPGIQYYPVEGTIEDNLWDIPEMNSFELIVKDNPFIKVDSLIDNVCPGECPVYKEDHSECKSSIELCLLHKVFKNTNYSPEKINLLEKCKKEETSTEEAATSI